MGEEAVALNEKAVAAIFKALGDENRVRILKLLLTGEKCACVLLSSLQISQPTLSHHMKILADTGLVLGRKEGKWTHYSISAEGVDYARRCLLLLTGVEPEGAQFTCGEE